MTEPKKQSNPFSTGGGGPTFESRVQAAFTVLMLTGWAAPCLPSWPIKKIKLQGRYAGFSTDDLIVFAEQPRTGREAKLMAQIKHKVSITERDETFAEVVQAAWSDFNGTDFDTNTDAFALITGPLSAADIDNVRPVLEWARFSENEKEFLGKVGTANFSSDAKRAKLAVFRTHLVNANGGADISDKQLWQFLKAFHLLGYDLDTETGGTASLLQALIAQHSTEGAPLLWSRVVDAVQSADQNAGTITPENLPEDIRAAFGASGNAGWASDLRKLEDHGSYILDSIKTTVGGVHIELPGPSAELLQKSETSSFVFISGERGSGKSSLIRQLADSLKGRAPVFCLRTEDLDKAHLDNVFSSIGLTSSLGDLAAGFALMPRKYLLIESLEKLLELQNTTAFVDLLSFCKRHQGWRIIATGRDYALQNIIFNFLQPSETDYSTLTLSGFSEEHIRSLCEKLPSLGTMVRNPSLRPLLATPFFADLAYRVTETGTQFSVEEGEREFQETVWRVVIAKEQSRAQGMPLKRRRTFIDIAVKRAKQMVYGVADTGFDEEALLGLEGDNLVRRQPAGGLVSPAHDVLEDWALEQHIDDAYRATPNDVRRFLDEVGHEPAMNRAFRLWLHGKLRNGGGVNDLVIDALSDDEVQDYWQDETIAAVLLGSDPYAFLSMLKEHLFSNSGDLLKRFYFVLRVACKTIDPTLTKQLSGDEEPARAKPLILEPYGRGWDAVIWFLLENKVRISEDLIPHVVAVLTDWTWLVYGEVDLPETARNAGLLALHALGYLKDSYRDEGTREDVLKVIVATAPAIDAEFNDLLSTDVFDTSEEGRRLSYVRQLCEVALGNVDSVILCRHLPDTVVNLALHEWFICESDEDRRRRWYRSRKDVEECFGLHGYRYHYSPACGRRGPFAHLLRFHPRKGLDFILEVLNRAAEAYANSDLDSPERYSYVPSPSSISETKRIKVRLADGTSVDQYCSERLWLGYRGHSVVPDLLQSALMALENWLISLAEHAKSHQSLQWLFGHVLRSSNSVMPTAVLASVATGFPSKVGEAALPLVRVPDLYGLDMARVVHERGAIGFNWFGFGLRRDPLADLCAAERREANLRSWRQEHLETLIVRFQFSDLRDEAFVTLDGLRANAPHNQSWQFRFHRIDSRTWRAVEDRENNRVLFEPKDLEPELEAAQQETQEQSDLINRFSTLYLWSSQTFDREPLDREYYADWHEALSEAKALWEILQGDTAPDLARMHYGSIVKAATVLIRDHSSELPEADVSWCAELMAQTVAAYADTDNTLEVVDQTDHLGAAAAASVLPVLFDFATAETDRQSLKGLIAVALTHVNDKVRNEAADGVREHLWQRDQQFAQNCVTGSVEYARFERDVEERRRRLNYLEEEERQAESAALHALKHDFRETFARGALSVEIDAMGFRSHNARYILAPYSMVPNGSADPTHVSLWSRMLALLFEPGVSETEQVLDEYDDERIPYDLPLKIASRFSDYLLGFPDSGMRIFADQLRVGCDAAPAFIDYLLMHVAASTEKTRSKERYWVIWGELSEKVQSIAIQLAARTPWTGRGDDGRKLVRGMLAADIQWQRVDYETQDIALGKEQILEFVANAGMNPDVFEATASLMYHFPSIFFESGIRILSRHIGERDGAALLGGVNSKYYLERAIQHFLRIDETGPLPREMHRACLEALLISAQTSKLRSPAA
jgi:hypothetical protein